MDESTTQILQKISFEAFLCWRKVTFLPGTKASLLGSFFLGQQSREKFTVSYGQASISPQRTPVLGLSKYNPLLLEQMRYLQFLVHTLRNKQTQTGNNALTQFFGCIIPLSFLYQL